MSKIMMLLQTFALILAPVMQVNHPSPSANRQNIFVEIPNFVAELGAYDQKDWERDLKSAIFRSLPQGFIKRKQPTGQLAVSKYVRVGIYVNAKIHKVIVYVEPLKGADRKIAAKRTYATARIITCYLATHGNVVTYQKQ